MRKVLLAATAVLVLALMGFGVAVGITSAQGEDGGVFGSFLARVAEKLGVSEDDLRTAITETQQELIDEAVAEGRLTPEQAERLRQRIEEGGPLRPPDRLHPRHRVRPVGMLVLHSAATVLDIEPQELLSELRQGNSLAEVAEAQGMSVEDFKAALLTQVQVKLDDLVAQDKLAQEQADRIFQDIEEYIDRIVNAHPRPHGLGPLRNSPPHDGPESAEPSEVTA